MSDRAVIRLSKSSLGEAEKRAVMRVLDREYLGMGEEVQRFEEQLEGFLSRPVACVNSGTSALHLALQACGIGSGDEVLVPSLTYVASFQAIAATGAVPVACEVNDETLTLDWRDAERRVTPRTRAIMPVHYAGGTGQLDEVYALADRHRLRVIEDAAHAFGSEHGGKTVGSFGDIACFSFDGIKNITSGEGGCVCTADEQVLRAVQNSRLLGVEKDTERRFAEKRSWQFDVVEQGWRYHMSNIMAAIGQEQLKRIGEFRKKRQAIAKGYVATLQEVGSLSCLGIDYDSIVPHIFVVKVEEEDREPLVAFLRENLIECGVHYFPNHLLTLFRTAYRLPVTEKLGRQIISLPCHLDLSGAQQAYVVQKLKEYFGVR